MEMVADIGPLCRIIRAGRVGGPTTEGMKQACGYKDVSSIDKFERGERNMRRDKFERYVAALGLKPEQEELLLKMHRSSVKRDAYEAALGFYSFRLIREKKYTPLNRLAEQLKGTPFPAYVMDELWFVHAFNAQIMKLLNMNDKDLRNPLSWHVVTTKYNPESPVRYAHRELEIETETEDPNTDAQTEPRESVDRITGFGSQYFPFAVRLFLEEISPYYFTRQVRSLLKLLYKLSPNDFKPLWESLSTMGYFPRAESPTRNIYYQDKLISMALAHQLPTEVQIANGPTLKYRLVFWLPQGTEAEAVQKEIRDAVAGRPITYAADPKYRVPDISKWAELSLDDIIEKGTD